MRDARVSGHRKAAPKLYLECGDHDYYNAQDGAEFLHRILWENRIGHEYRLLQDCDHVGASLKWRLDEAHRWIGRMAKQLQGDVVEAEPTEAQQTYLSGAYRGELMRPPTEDERLSISDERAILAHRRAIPDYLAKFADDPFGGVFRKPSKD